MESVPARQVAKHDRNTPAPSPDGESGCQRPPIKDNILRHSRRMCVTVGCRHAAVRIQRTAAAERAAHGELVPVTWKRRERQCTQYCRLHLVRSLKDRRSDSRPDRRLFLPTLPVRDGRKLLWLKACQPSTPPPRIPQLCPPWLGARLSRAWSSESDLPLCQHLRRSRTW